MNIPKFTRTHLPSGRTSTGQLDVNHHLTTEEVARYEAFRDSNRIAQAEKVLIDALTRNVAKWNAQQPATWLYSIN